MQADQGIIARLTSVQWFARCGMSAEVDLQASEMPNDSIPAVCTAMHSDNWLDANTHAQGELTGYLATANYELYGTTWNRLGDEIEAQLRSEVMPNVDAALARIGAEALSEQVLLDLTRIGLWASYSKRFKNVPDFFGRLLKVYESGHLPCGWIGDLGDWPNGTLVIY